ncbi:HEAT repeat domain-containing protein [Cellulomonas sp. Marseille-Q8402]
MSRRDEHRAALRALDADAVRAYLTAGSGLPGPRANLELMAACADVAPPELLLDLADEPDEYLRCCGTVGLGRLLVESVVGPAALRARAADPSWRVREAVAMALQRVGDADPAMLRDLVADWGGDPDPLVRRAAVAGVCEPRLLRDPATAAAALRACAAGTASIEALPAAARRDPDVRTLRQALGYCWSVAVAGDPAAGLPAFAALTTSADPDTQWVVRANRTKARLRRLLEEQHP